MSKLPVAAVAVQQIEPPRLPISSYRQRGHQFGRFQPFEVWGDADAWGNNQLNWTNLFLLNKLGGKEIKVEDIDTTDTLLGLKDVDESTLKEIKKLGKSLSEEFGSIKDQIDKMKDATDLKKIQDQIKKIRFPEDMDTRILKLENEIKKITKLVKAIAERFAIPAPV